MLIHIYPLKILIRLTDPYYLGVVSLRIEKPKITCGRLCILFIVLIIVAPFVSAWWPRGPSFEEVTDNTPSLLWNATRTIHDSFVESTAIGNINPGVDTEVVSVADAWGLTNGTTPLPASCISLRRGDMGDLEWSYEFNNTVSNVALGDLDHDGYSEVICAVEDTGVFAFKGNGTVYWFYPQPVLHTSLFTSPVVSDILGNHGPEVIVPTTDGSIYVLNGTTGKLLWSVDTHLGISGSVAVGDINGDSQREIVLNSGDYTYAYTIGNSTPLWFHQWTSGVGLTAPIIADINGDGKVDVIVASSAVTALNGADGSVLWQYEQTPNDWFTACAVGDINGDGQLEVVSANSAHLCALRGGDGSVLWTYSASAAFSRIGYISIIDFDGVTGIEIVMSGWASTMTVAINAEDGTNAWSYLPSGNVLFQEMPAIGDINDNGRLDIVVPCTPYGGNLGLYAIEPLSSGGDLYWNCQGGTSNYTHTNCLEDTDSDCDGLSNALEHSIGTNVSSRDSDGDSIPDAWEYFHGFNPLDPVVPWNEFVMFNSTPLAAFVVTAVSILAVLVIAKKKRWIGERRAEDAPDIE